MADHLEIVNFFESKHSGASASEYVKRNGLSAQITQHFLGSGVYGFIDPQNAMAYHGDLSAFSGEIFELANPFIIPAHLYEEIFENAFRSTMRAICQYLTRLDLLIRGDYDGEISQNREAPEYPYPVFCRYIGEIVNHVSTFDHDLCVQYPKIQRGWQIWQSTAMSWWIWTM